MELIINTSYKTCLTKLTIALTFVTTKCSGNVPYRLNFTHFFTLEFVLFVRVFIFFLYVFVRKNTGGLMYILLVLL